MATVSWLGKAGKTAQVDTLTVGGTAAAGQVYTATMNSKAVAYTSVTGDTNTTIASSLASALSSTTNAEFLEETWSPSSAVITGTAVNAGTPFTVTTSATGTGTLTQASVTANVSPNDIANTANWGGSLPANSGDSLVFEDGSQSLLYNIESSFASKTFVAVTRYASFTGSIGAPRYNSLGYAEYRGTTFTCAGITTLTIYQAQGDQAEQMKFNVGSAGSCAVKIFGNGGSSFGEEVCQWKGTGAGNTVEMSNGSLVIAPLATDTATVSTIKMTGGGTIRCTAGVTFGGTNKITQSGGQIQIASALQDWSIYDGGVGYIYGSAAMSGNLYIQSGTFYHMGSGNITDAAGDAVTVGPNSTIDFSGATSAITIAGKIYLMAGASYLDPLGRVTESQGISLLNCKPADVTVVKPPNGTITWA